MKRSAQTRLADMLGRHLVRIMPPAESDWAAGMRAEIETIERPGEALGFALGCVGVGYGRRLRTVSGALTAIRWMISATTVAFAGLVLAVAHTLLAQQTPGVLPHVVGGLGLAFMTAGLALVRAGPGPLAVIAAGMLALNTAGLWATDRTVLLHADIFRALALEGYLLWSALLLAGLTLHHAARSTRLLAFARRRGWQA